MNRKKIFWIAGIMAYTLIVTIASKHLFYEKGNRHPANEKLWRSHSVSNGTVRVHTLSITHEGISCIALSVKGAGGGIDCDFDRVR